MGAAKKAVDTVRPFLFKTGAGEFCEQFNQYFYTNIYARSVGRPLVVYDQTNPVSPSFSILKSTFQEVSNTTFVDSMVANATTLIQHDPSRVIPYVNSLTRDEIQLQATSILEWSPSMISEISKMRTQYNIPDIINVGVHISSNTVQRQFDPVSTVAPYLQAVNEINNNLKNPEVLSVFVVAERSELLEEFMRGARPNWKIYTIPQVSMTVNGFSVASFERQNVRLRTQAYNEFVTMLSCLQTSENLITSLSNEVGKFLFMTNTTMTYFRSMEAATFLAR